MLRWKRLCLLLPRYTWMQQRCVTYLGAFCSNVATRSLINQCAGTGMCLLKQTKLSEDAFRMVVNGMSLPEQHVEVLAKVCGFCGPINDVFVSHVTSLSSSINHMQKTFESACQEKRAQAFHNIGIWSGELIWRQDVVFENPPDH